MDAPCTAIPSVKKKGRRASPAGRSVWKMQQQRRSMLPRCQYTWIRRLSSSQSARSTGLHACWVVAGARGASDRKNEQRLRNGSPHKVVGAAGDPREAPRRARSLLRPAPDRKPAPFRNEGVQRAACSVTPLGSWLSRRCALASRGRAGGRVSV